MRQPSSDHALSPLAPDRLARYPVPVMSTATSPQPPATERVRARLQALHHLGEFTAADAETRGLRLVEAVHGAEHAADHIQLWLLVDEGGVVRDARFRTLATGIQLAAYDVMAELAVGRSVADGATITPAMVDERLRDDPAAPALALGEERDRPYYVLVKAAERLHGAKPAGEPAPSAAKPTQPSGAAALPWLQIGLFEKVRRIEAVLDEHVRPALASDGGGIDLVDLKSDELWVQYHGACGSCSSSIGGTLQFIQDSLNNHLGTSLAVRVSGMDEDEGFIDL